MKALLFGKKLLGLIVVATFCVGTQSSNVLAQDSGAVAETAPSDAKKSFDSVFGEWKTLLGEMRLLQTQAEESEDSELAEMQKTFDGMVAKGETIIPRLRDAAIEVYKEEPNQDRQIARWLSDISNDYVKNDRFDDAKPALDALIEGKSSDSIIYNDAGIVAFATHDFEAAKEYLTKAASAGVLTGNSQMMLSEVDNYIEYWEREKALREKSEAATGEDKLPIVKIETNKGTMLVELFEDEAPETVGNFISLIESKNYYDGLTFHRVLGGFMAQGGCPSGTGTGGPGYNIYCECVNPDHRKHFRGSLSMAHAGRDTGGSQFFLTFLPTPQLNGKHTVFGRVIEGLDVLERIQRRDPDDSADVAIEPDKIIKAEVVSKRDHKYLPNKVK